MFSLNLDDTVNIAVAVMFAVSTVYLPSYLFLLR